MAKSIEELIKLCDKALPGYPEDHKERHKIKIYKKELKERLKKQHETSTY